MAKKFNVSITGKLGEINVSIEGSNVTEKLFWKILEDKVMLVTINVPENLEKNLTIVKDAILAQRGPMVIEDLSFEITGKD